MSIDSFLNYSGLCFKEDEIDLKKKKIKNKISINLFNEVILQKNTLDGYFTIAIGEFLEKGKFYLKIIGEENKNVQNFSNINNTYENKIKNFLNNNNLKYLDQKYLQENGYSKTKENSKIRPKIVKSKIKSHIQFKLKNPQISNLFRNDIKSNNNKIKSNKLNKIHPIKSKLKKRSNSGCNYNLNETIDIKNRKWINKEYKLFNLVEEIEGKCLLILPFSIEIPDDFYASCQLKYNYFEENYLDIIHKYQNSINGSDSNDNSLSIENNNQNTININYKLLIYYISDTANNGKYENEKEKQNYFDTLKESNNYFENSISFNILPNINKLKLNYEKILKYDIKLKTIRFNFLCLKFYKYYDIHIKLNKRILNNKDSNMDIIFYFNKNICSKYKYWDILIISRFKNKIKNEMIDNILYISSNELKNDKNLKTWGQFIKKINLNNINKKVACFETFEEINSYFVIFYISKNSFKFEYLVKEIPIHFYNDNLNLKNNFKTKLQIIQYYKELEKKINRHQDISLLPFCMINN